MAKLTITDAAKLAKISRQHLYKKYINTGIISTIKEDEKSFIDVSELIRVFPHASIDVNLNDSSLHELTNQNTDTTPIVDSKNQTIKLLEQQLQEAKQREDWLKSQIDELRHQQNYLLEDKTPKKRKKFLGIF